ncbi:hypothetical protein D3C84_990060 [compost metagenome]
MPAANFFEQFRKPAQVARQVARINRDGNQRLWQFGVDQRAFGQFRQQPGGQVVDAVIAVVLENIERGAFT